MTIKGIFRIQIRFDLPETPSGAPHGKVARPPRRPASTLKPHRRPGIRHLPRCPKIDPRPTCRSQHASIVIGSSGPKELIGRWRLCRHAVL